MNESVKKFIEYHWKYYRNLEEDFIQPSNPFILVFDLQCRVNYF